MFVFMFVYVCAGGVCGKLFGQDTRVQAEEGDGEGPALPVAVRDASFDKGVLEVFSVEIRTLEDTGSVL
jgi:hypothetical protein